MPRCWRSAIQETQRKAADDAEECVAPDFAKQRFPHCIVWTPIHPITWFLPFVGHMGICDSRGVIYDFTGAVCADELAFGETTRYLPLKPAKVRGAQTQLLQADSAEAAKRRCWDGAIVKSNEVYEHKLHCMVCGSDCHSHVARALNEMRYAGHGHWNKVTLAAWIFFCGRHVGWAGVVKTWLGAALVAAVFLCLRVVGH
eukprot:TRINITY_DN33343_c0_g1_i1.p1 TRINITY_DN33343_c0_g1~~TRINITY_DN33343_c0_g1_i1.p1  ORF type:complete len:200 (+),score=31.07 TRINITY_DN33343_c0_g1_i1:84-683(+)